MCRIFWAFTGRFSSAAAPSRQRRANPRSQPAKTGEVTATATAPATTWAGNWSRKREEGKLRNVIAIICCLTLWLVAGCGGSMPPEEVEVIRNVERVREVEVTRLVEVTRTVPVTRLVTVVPGKAGDRIRRRDRPDSPANPCDQRFPRQHRDYLQRLRRGRQGGFPGIEPRCCRRRSGQFRVRVRGRPHRGVAPDLCPVS